jgi:hypothetical protein
MEPLSLGHDDAGFLHGIMRPRPEVSGKSKIVEEHAEDEISSLLKRNFFSGINY